MRQVHRLYSGPYMRHRGQGQGQIDSGGWQYFVSGRRSRVEHVGQSERFIVDRDRGEEATRSHYAKC